MIEMRCFKNALTFNQTILNFMLSRKIVNIYNDIARKYQNVTVKDFRKYENLVLVLQKEDTKIRHRLSQQLQTTWYVFKTCYL